jgi:hypothetical protein
MRLTTEVLIDFAQNYVKERKADQPTVFSAYLRGSVLYGPPFLGGQGDLDIVFIHTIPPEVPREIKRLTPEIHFDIEHHDQTLYQEPRQVRVHPWLGPTLHDAQILYDTRHFLDFVQAGVRGQFHEPAFVLERAETTLQKARQFWLELQLQPPSAGPEVLEDYLAALEQAVNALVLLAGPPLPVRRLGLELPNRTQELGVPQLYGHFLSLLGGNQVDLEPLKQALNSWEACLEALPAETCPMDLHPHRIPYYRDAMLSMLDGDHPKSMLWPLLTTWTRAISHLPKDHPLEKEWEAICQELEIAGEYFPPQLEAFDDFLENIEAVLGQWKEDHGEM